MKKLLLSFYLFFKHILVEKLPFNAIIFGSRYTNISACKTTPNLNGERRFLRGWLHEQMLAMKEDMILDHDHSDGGHTHTCIFRGGSLFRIYIHKITSRYSLMLFWLVGFSGCWEKCQIFDLVYTALKNTKTVFSSFSLKHDYFKILNRKGARADQRWKIFP